MVEENTAEAGTGENTGAAVQGQDQKTAGAPVASAIPDDLQGKTQITADGTVFVPLASLVDERTKRQGLEGELGTAKEQLYMYSMNPPGGGAPANQPAANQGQPAADAEPKPVDVPEVLSNMQDTEMINAGELKTIIKGLKAPAPSGSPGQDERTQLLLGEQILSNIHSDAETILMGKFAERMRLEPHIAHFINRVPAILKPFVAYRLGKGLTEAQAVTAGAADAKGATGTGEQGKTSGQSTVDQIIDNAGKPIATSQLVGSGALDTAMRFQTMSDEDFEAEVERVKGGG